MFKRTYLGLDIRRDGLRALSVQRAGGGVALLGGQLLQLSEGVMDLQAQEPNIRQPEDFVAAVQEVLLPLAKGEERLAVALPDAAGHVFLLDIATPFSKPQEGEEIVRWHLKDRLPVQNRRVALAYQVLEERDAGRNRLLVSVLAREVLNQYEELLGKAGFAAVVVDFHSLNVYNAYRSRVDLGTDFYVVSVDDRQLSLFVFENRRLVFFRDRTVPADAERVFQELNRTLVGYRRAHSPLGRASVYLHSNWPQPDELQEAVRAAFDHDIALLPSPLQPLVNAEKLAISTAEANSMAAALGVAERMIQRVSR